MQQSQPPYPPPFPPQPPQQPHGQPQYPQQPAPYPPHPQQPYPQQPQYPQQPYPPQAYPPQQGRPQQGQPPYGQPQYGPPAQYGQPGYPPGQYPAPQQQGGPPIVIPIEGRGVAKLAAKMTRRSLIISQEGFAHEDKHGTFRVAWSELRRITVTTAYHQDRTKLVAPKVWRVRVILDMADPNYPQRHPELASLQGKYGGTGPGSYGMPLGPVNNIVPQLAQALATYGGQVFGGVIEEGQVIGFGYR
jgi:hypothetical protein